MKHHSSGDFDFVVAQWSLSAVQFISAPTSLYLTRPAGDVANVGLLHHSDSGVMEEGRLVSWIRSHTLGANRRNLVVFRNPSADASAVITGSYAVMFSQSYITWIWYTGVIAYDVIAAIYVAGDDFITAGVWAKLRFSWWNGVNLLNLPATVVRVEKYVVDEWVQFGDDVYDTNERNKGNPVQRTGVGVHCTGTGNISWWDDTEFWKP